MKTYEEELDTTKRSNRGRGLDARLALASTLETRLEHEAG